MSSEAGEIIAQALEADAFAQEAGRLELIGLKYDDVLQAVLPINDLPQDLFGLAFGFWDDWLDASNHHWLHHEPMTERDWPMAARSIAQSLRTASLPTDPMILRQFLPKPPLPSLLQKLKQWLSARA